VRKTPVRRAGPARRACPRTGRRRANALPPGAVRPSDLLVGFFAIAVLWLLAAAVAAVAAVVGGVYEARWVALHLAFLGGVSQLVLGAAQFFVCAFLATDPPAGRAVRAQLAVWNAGVLAVAVGVPAGLTALSGVGGALLLAGLALFAAALRAMQRRSLQRAPWAARWYLAAALALAGGALLGPVIAAGVAWPHGSLLATHLVLNLGGWFGTAIVGTLHTFYPSLTSTRLRRPRLEPVTFAAWTSGIAMLAAATAFQVHLAAVAGWALLLGATLLLATNLVASAHAAERHPPPAVLVGAGQALLVCAAAVGLIVTAASGASAALLGPDRVLVALPAMAGWIGLTVAGSLLHLLALMARVRRLDRAAGPPRRDRLPLAAGGAIVAGVVTVAAAHGFDLDALKPPAAVILAAGYATLAVRIIALAARAVRAAPLRL
jgi:nitrite reductase (NO-forming)